MTLTITPGRLSGAITPPASKSQTHRVIIAAALSGGNSRISNVSGSLDITATLNCMAAMGAAWQEPDPRTVAVSGIGADRKPAAGIMDCGESGSTLRFLIPVSLAVCGGGTFRGHGRLMERPQTPYFELFDQKGIAYRQQGDTLTVTGRLTPGTYALPGDVSSQFITGLMYALPLLEGDSEIVLTTRLESSGYVDMTIDALRQFGVTVVPTETGWRIPGNQVYQAKAAAVEPDFSQAGFYYAAAGMGNPVEITGMNPQSVQGDRMVLDYMKKLDGTGEVILDVRECPDLVPPLAVRAALRDGEITRIVNAGRLRIKESDRLASVTQVLTALGAKVQEQPDSLTIYGVDVLRGGVTVDSWNDHRIAMMAGIAATCCREPVTITGAESVRKSYPGFWDDLRTLGLSIREV